jgi:hypothetical protein
LCDACAISWSSCSCASSCRSLCTLLSGKCTCEIVCSSSSTWFCTIVVYLCMRPLLSQNLSTGASSRCWSRYLRNPLRVSYQSFGLRMCWPSSVAVGPLRIHCTLPNHPVWKGEPTPFHSDRCSCRCSNQQPNCSYQRHFCALPGSVRWHCELGLVKSAD